ncbi:MAG: arsenic efflux protein [Bacteroidales bacterium]|nr:arsenic efflux protein [Candidatus Cryptobacteroides aphodequi]
MIFDVLRNSILVTGLVIVMMMMIECFNVSSEGKFFRRMRASRFGQVAFSALLGSIPGCVGGFAAVSLYTHGLLSFGALIAMMIASSGDEAFVMLAMMPDKAAVIFGVLFVIAIGAGLAVDALGIRGSSKTTSAPCEGHLEIHPHEAEHSHENRHPGWKRIVLLLFTAIFGAALVFGWLGEEEAAELQEAGGFNLLSEEWMYILFGVLCIGMLAVIVFASDHFVEEHLWHHIIVKHLPRIFCWTAGMLLLISAGMRWLDLESLIGGNTALMIILATLVGIIPESGPHLIFVTLYAAGLVPLPVLLASCISQDGHAALPLLAESKGAFLRAKLINCVVAAAAGFAALLLGIL